jgi:putative endonuclease
MFYVYIIRSVEYPDQIYVGRTEDLKTRLSAHDSGNSPHTSKYAPWKLETYIAFVDKSKALSFEEYLKSGTGRQFRNKRLL